MAIKFEIFDIPEPICEQKVSAAEEEKISKRVRKSNIALRRAMERISQKEAESRRFYFHRR